MNALNTHLMFCCGSRCKDYEIRNLMENNEAICHNRDNVILGEDRYVFIIGWAHGIERIIGLKFKDYWACVHYRFSNEVASYLHSRHAGMFGR